jgi:ribonucleotide reductase beta subunit family protein with ferritin-like domain
MKGRFWIPEKIAMTTDQTNFSTLPEAAKELYTTNLQWQIFADTLNSTGLAERLIPLCNNIELKRCIILQTFEESNHSDSYSHIVAHMYNEPSEVNDTILDNELILARVSRFNDLYSDKGTELYQLLIMILALESVSFVSSFLTTFALNDAFDNKLTNTADQILQIAADELGHQTLFSNVIKIHRKHNPDYNWDGFAEELFGEVYQEELKWRAALYAIYPLPQLEFSNFNKFLKYKIHQAMKGAGLKPLFEKVSSEEYVVNWYNTVSNINNTNTALQEGNNISYNKDVLLKDWNV